jgi:hypothetical protein
VFDLQNNVKSANPTHRRAVQPELWRRAHAVPGGGVRTHPGRARRRGDGGGGAWPGWGPCTSLESSVTHGLNAPGFLTLEPPEMCDLLVFQSLLFQMQLVRCYIWACSSALPWAVPAVCRPRPRPPATRQRRRRRRRWSRR